MKWYNYLICYLLIILGTFSLIRLVDIWTRTSSVVGSPTTIEIQNNYELVCKYDLSTMIFETEDYQMYTSNNSYAHLDFDGTDGNYKLLINDKLLSDVTVHAGKIEADYSRNFYDFDKSIITTVDLNIVVYFYNDETLITVQTKNVNNSQAYLMQYMATDGFILKVVKGVN